MLILNVPIIQTKGMEPTKYFDMVIVNRVVGINFIRDLFTKFRDFFGGASKSYHKVIEDTISACMEELKSVARDKGANAIINTKVESVSTSSKGTAMWSITICGTPCIIPDIEKKGR